MYDKQGVFKGINWAAIISIVIGSLCSLVIVQLSWYVSLIPTGLVYYFLMKNMKSAKSFRTGTIFQEQEGCYLHWAGDSFRFFIQKYQCLIQQFFFRKQVFLIPVKVVAIAGGDELPWAETV